MQDISIQMKIKIDNSDLFQNISQFSPFIWEGNIIESTDLFDLLK